jgi:hypothetical protein
MDKMPYKFHAPSVLLEEFTETYHVGFHMNFFQPLAALELHWNRFLTMQSPLQRSAVFIVQVKSLFIVGFVKARISLCGKMPSFKISADGVCCYARGL